MSHSPGFLTIVCFRAERETHHVKTQSEETEFAPPPNTNLPNAQASSFQVSVVSSTKRTIGSGS